MTPDRLYFAALQAYAEHLRQKGDAVFGPEARTLPTLDGHLLAVGTLEFLLDPDHGEKLNNE